MTDKGENACLRHTVYDRKCVSDFLIEISKYCTAEEINAFFKVLHYRSEYFEQLTQKEKKEYEEELKKRKYEEKKAGK